MGGICTTCKRSASIIMSYSTLDIFTDLLQTKLELNRDLSDCSNEERTALGACIISTN